MRIGSLFSGAGGLDLAVEAVFSGTVVWQAEIDKAASKVLAHRFPGVPNLGSVTDIDWATVPPVDVLCGGFPCQDVSAAGKRAGIKAGTRSGLWSEFAEAIDALRPQYVVIENVRGLLNANANRPMEPGPDALGEGADRPVLRAIGAVLGDICDIGGYEARWVTVAAADVGAPHGRERVFILASDASRNGRGWGAERQQAAQLAAPRRDDADRRVLADGRDIGRPSTSHSASHGRDEGRPEPARVARNLREVIVNELPEPTLLSTPQARDFKGVPADNFNNANLCRDVANTAQWGKYAPAIARWEQIVGPAPAPTEPNKNGNPRLSAAFSEWLMGWPAGWVTDPSIGISRNDQLRIVGNGVCPQQAIAALRYLLAVTA